MGLSLTPQTIPFEQFLTFDIVRHISTLLAKIIKTSKLQNSAWLCGFLEVPYLSLNKRLCLVHERGVWVKSFTSGHKSYSLIASIRTGAIPYPIRFYRRIVSRVSSTKHAKRKLNQELPFLIYLFLQRRTAPHRTEQTANATETFATSTAPVSGLIFSVKVPLLFTETPAFRILSVMRYLEK